MSQMRLTDEGPIISKTAKKQKPIFSEAQTNELDKKIGNAVAKGVNGIVGDMSEYLNYLHERLDQISESLGLPLLDYEEELAARYDFELRKTKEK